MPLERLATYSLWRAVELNGCKIFLDGGVVRAAIERREEAEIFRHCKILV